MKSKQSFLNISFALQRKVLPLIMLGTLSGCFESSGDSSPTQEDVSVVNEVNATTSLSSHLQQLRSDYLDTVNSGKSFNADSTSLSGHLQQLRSDYLDTVNSGKSFNADSTSLSSHLQQLRSDYLDTVNSGKSFNADSTGAAVVAGQDVILTITSTEQEVAALKTRLQQLGMTNISQYKHLLSGKFPISRLAELNNVSGISWVTSSQAQRHMTPGGRAYNAADAAQFSDVVRKQYNLDGSGVTIGVMSDSYNCLGGAANDILSGDLPGDVVVIKEYSFCKDDPRPDEGRAMMQLIHDIAPGAKLLFHTAWEGPIDFAVGIQRLADAGADIIVDDIGYLTMPMFQEGPIAQSVNEVQARGVSYFSAAGNSARYSYEQNFERGQTAARDFAHDFGLAAGKASDFYQQITIPKGGVFKVTLQWDNASEISGGKGAETDLDLFLMDAENKRVLASSQDINIGHDPVEFIAYLVPDDETVSTVFNLYISHRAGPIPKKIKYAISQPKQLPWPVVDSGSLVQRLHVGDNANILMPDNNPLTGGRAVIIRPDFLNLGDTNFIFPSLLQVGAGGEPIKIREGDGQYGLVLGGQFYPIDTDENPILFIPDGFTALVNNGVIELFSVAEESVFTRIDEYATQSSTIYGHNNASGAIAVGAMPYPSAPWFSGDLRIDYFSSAGGTPILFDQQGNRLSAPEYRFKPEIVAVDDVNTTFFPLGDLADTDSDQDGFPNFSGTSAAAPNAAAVAALLLQQYTYLIPGQVKQVMMRGTLDLVDPTGLPGPQEVLSNPCATDVVFDWGTGCGLIQADLIFAAVETSPELSQNIAGLKADFNNDGCVDSQDNTILLAVMRASSDVQRLYDLTGDGQINAQDFNVLQGMLGAGCSS
ncbi:MAG: S8 family serine peptidase [Methyloprofundus sp.]|nr:S8 family serine peptidase [Methyloprofundus sp.]